MTISALHTILITQATRGKISLNKDLVSWYLMTCLQENFGLATDEFLIISGITTNDIPAAKGDTITITAGSVDVLSLSNLPVHLVFTVSDNTVDVCLQIQLSSTWKFTDSFPDLTLFPFDIITPTDVVFVYSSKKQDNFKPAFNTYVTTITIVEGLNFISNLSLKDISILGTLPGINLPDNHSVLSGSFSVTTKRPYPVMELSVSIASSGLTILSDVSFTSIDLLVKISDPGKGKSIQDFSFGLQAQTTDMSYFIILNSGGETLNFGVGPAPQATLTLKTITNSHLVKSILPPGVDFGSFVPEVVSNVVDSIELKQASFSFSIKNKNISNVAFTIGLKPDGGSQFSIGPFGFDNISLNTSWMDPEAVDAIAFVALSGQTTIGLKVFPDPFYFNISLSEINNKWEIDLIEAQYYGAISLSNILNEVAPGTTVPSVLNDLHFGKFYVRADPAEETFTCSCQGAFGAEIVGRTFSSNFNLMLTKSSSGTDFKLSGGFAVGNDYWFNINANLDKDSTSTQFRFTAKTNDIPLSAIADHLLEDFDIEDFKFPEMNFTSVILNYNTPMEGEMEIKATYAVDKDSMFGESGTITIKRKQMT